MAMKEWFRQMQPVQLYIVLGLSVAFFTVELVASHTTHALTLLTDSYHMLCNIIALTGCILALKYGTSKETMRDADRTDQHSLGSSSVGEELTTKPSAASVVLQSPCPEEITPIRSNSATQKEKSLRNTFGWARIDVVVMLICCVFLFSLCFSIFVEALQTLVHIDHQDEMHNPILVLCIGSCGLILNGICYLLIGGYTFHQGSFLYVTPSGDVVLDRVVTSDSVKRGERRLSRTRHMVPSNVRERENCTEMFRDISGCVFVIVCSLIIYFTDKTFAKFVDPIMSMFSSATLMSLSYPYVKESCLILLQTMPDTINIDSLKTKLLDEFPDIINVHDLHVWQLTTTKIISTAHIIFKNPMIYAKYTKELNEFFVENGITQVTIQPEFFTKNVETVKELQMMKSAEKCLMNCLSEGCKDSHCCPDQNDQEPPKSIFKTNLSRSVSRELPQSDSTVDLKSVRIVDNETTSNASSTPSKHSSRCSSSCNSLNSLPLSSSPTAAAGATVTTTTTTNNKAEDSNESNVNNKNNNRNNAAGVIEVVTLVSSNNKKNESLVNNENNASNADDGGGVADSTNNKNIIIMSSCENESVILNKCLDKALAEQAVQIDD